MQLHPFQRTQLVETPWKNSGGITREIASYPAAAGTDDFDWRVSIATIAASGPFSAFPGVDRVIILLDGGGVRLRSGDGGIDCRLDDPLVPFAFPGEAQVGCDLLAGTSSDFNVMTRRRAVRAEVRILRDATALSPGAQGLVFIARGAWEISASGQDSGRTDIRTLKADQGIWWHGAPHRWELLPTEPAAALISVQFLKVI